MLLIGLGCDMQRDRLAAQFDKPVSQRVVIESAIRERLKDPESARFPKVVIEGGQVCGLVNAKNSLGGYTGNIPFAGWYSESEGQGRFAVMRIGESEEDARWVYDHCFRLGLDL